MTGWLGCEMTLLNPILTFELIGGASDLEDFWVGKPEPMGEDGDSRQPD